jgi:rhamnosyltransferase
MPAGASGEYLDQKTVITSGTLVDAPFARSIGGLREDYFIDQLDHEFCLRARAHGGRVVISREPLMEHSVGEAGGAWLPWVGPLPKHSPVRKYYVARNSLVTIARYWRTEPDWCLRRATRLLVGLPLMAVLERQRIAKVRAFFAGITDALRGRMGPCRHGWLLRSGG